MQSDGKVSVIIPTYNRSRYITQSIESVLSQTYTDYEIVVVDDGSTDDTKKVLQPYMDRIQYIYQEHAGVSAARNHGVRESKGQYIAFLDSDDLWLPEKLESQIKLVPDDDTIAFHAVEWFVERPEDERLLQRCKCVRWPTVSPDNCIDDPILAVASGCYLHLNAMLCRRSAFDKVGFFDEKLYAGEDEDWFFRAALRMSFCYLPQSLTKIRYHSSQINLGSERSVNSLIQVLERMKQRTKGVNAPAGKAADRRLAAKYSHLANILAMNRKRMRSSLMAVRAFWLEPLQLQRLAKALLFLFGYKTNSRT